MPVIERCTCDNGEAEDDRAAVLRCPVHGPKTFWRPTGDERTDEAVRAVIVAAWEQMGSEPEPEAGADFTPFHLR